MTPKIKLNNDIAIDIPKLIEGGMVILANSGGGKSYAIRRIAEQAVPHVQVIILDPEGEFASLREKFDFILAGKDADVPVEVRSAAMLATKLLELNKSAVIDLYELHPQERQRYVKHFCDALVNAPKHLYHPVIIILDEAHEYVPEGKPSEATWAVESLASKGRKRGQRLILASQRIAKISKNVTAECNNKLIGRASQDIDMKRAGDELGFSKDKLAQLRQLKPGEFFVFGNAISDEVQKIKVGEVKTAHAKVGYKGGAKTPPPSNVIKKVLAELKDLPKEAEKEAKTTAEMKTQITQLKRELSQKPQKIVENDPKLVEKAIKDTEKRMNVEFMAERDEFLKHINTMFKVITTVAEVVKGIKMPDIKERKKKTEMYKGMLEQPKENYMHAEPYRPTRDGMPLFSGKHDPESLLYDMNKGEIIVLKAIAQHAPTSPEHIAVLTGYKQTSRREYLRKLTARGYIRIEQGGYYSPTDEGIKALGDDHELLPTGDALREHLMRTLPEGERKILAVVLEWYPNGAHITEIEEKTGYKTTSRREYVRKLTARKLVTTVDGSYIKASEKLFD